MSGPRIVGIGLFRDEDRFVERAVRNVFGFCDELILVDHRSRDRTPEILERLASESPVPATVHRVADAGESHDLIACYAGSNAWVLGIDGDELYDPDGLRRFRPRLLAGEFDDWWLIRSNALHVTELDDERQTACGYMSPPSPSMVKLHNFSLIESWDGAHPQRLHGTDGLRFKPNHVARKLKLGKQYSWEASPLRCLHFCFVRRSSRDRGDRPRPTITDYNTPRRLPLRLWRRVIGVAPRSKLEHYRVGPLREVSTTPFSVSVE
jgi:glycosyltransferase involved in cell wall biosynthesis